MQIFLDMDGVIANFTKKAYEMLGYSEAEMIESLKTWKVPNNQSVTNQLDISSGDFWRAVYRKGSMEFWTSLEVIEEGRELLNELRKIGEVFILSAPTKDKNCWAGKVEWLSKHRLGFGNNIVLTKHKYLLAGTNKVLIDDAIENIVPWNEASQFPTGIYYPQPWNEASAETNKVEYVLNQISLMESNQWIIR